MTILEAYKLTLDRLLELKEKGLEVSIEIYNSPVYVDDFYLPVKYWRHCSIVVKSDDDISLVHKLQNKLNDRGIWFDLMEWQGGVIYWELNGSFNIEYLNNEEDHQELLDSIDDLLNQF